MRLALLTVATLALALCPIPVPSSAAPEVPPHHINDEDEVTPHTEQGHTVQDGIIDIIFDLGHFAIIQEVETGAIDVIDTGCIFAEGEQAGTNCDSKVPAFIRYDEIDREFQACPCDNPWLRLQRTHLMCNTWGWFRFIDNDPNTHGLQPRFWRAVDCDNGPCIPPPSGIVGCEWCNLYGFPAPDHESDSPIPLAECTCVDCPE